MKMHMIVLRMECNWRIFRMLRKLLNYMVSKGMKLNSFFVCLFSRLLDNCYADLLKCKNIYEEKIGVQITFYKKNVI